MCLFKGYQQVCIYDINSSSAQPLLCVEGTVKNTVSIGFSEKGLWMYTAGEDKTVKIWDMRFIYINFNKSYSHLIQSRLTHFSKGLKHINCAKTLNHDQPISCVALHPNQVRYKINYRFKYWTNLSYILIGGYIIRRRSRKYTKMGYSKRRRSSFSMFEDFRT